MCSSVPMKSKWVPYIIFSKQYNIEYIFLIHLFVCLNISSYILLHITRVCNNIRHLNSLIPERGRQSIDLHNSLHNWVSEEIAKMRHAAASNKWDELSSAFQVWYSRRSRIPAQFRLRQARQSCWGWSVYKLILKPFFLNKQWLSFILVYYFENRSHEAVLEANQARNRSTSSWKSLWWGRKAKQVVALLCQEEVYG